MDGLLVLVPGCVGIEGGEQSWLYFVSANKSFAHTYTRACPIVILARIKMGSSTNKSSYKYCMRI